MKLKVGTLLEAETMKLAKRRAAEEGRSLSDLIEDAIRQYLRNTPVAASERRAAYLLFCERPLKIPPAQLRLVLEENLWDS